MRACAGRVPELGCRPVLGGPACAGRVLPGLGVMAPGGWLLGVGLEWVVLGVSVAIVVILAQPATPYARVVILGVSAVIVFGVESGGAGYGKWGRDWV